MKMLAKGCALCLIVALLISFGTLLSERKDLGDRLIRLHIVANSDSPADQAQKLQVRDAVTDYIRVSMESVESLEEAKNWLLSQLPVIQAIADSILSDCGQKTVVTLEKESFPVRDYETFSLPSGVYESLRISIGEAQGKNWWCVVFPQLCIPATSEAFGDTAVGAGFSESLTKTLTHENGYEIRFFFLDWLGKLQNLLHRG